MKLLVLGNKLYANWINGDHEFLPEVLNSVPEADLVIFTGGADVHPSFYNDKVHHSTSTHINRDVIEMEFFKECVDNNKPMLGICRGSQFLTVCQSGGKLAQNINMHAIHGVHTIKFNTGEVMPITSTHHQMMWPFEVKDYELIAWSEEKRSYLYEFGEYTLTEVPEGKEPEIVFYPKTKCLCVQGHPESMLPTSPVISKLNTVIDTKLFNYVKV